MLSHIWYIAAVFFSFILSTSLGEERHFVLPMHLYSCHYNNNNNNNNNNSFFTVPWLGYHIPL